MKESDLFWDIWTGKEAYVKLLGRGLSYGLDRFVVDLSAGQILEEGRKTACLYRPLLSCSGSSGSVPPDLALSLCTLRPLRSLLVREVLF